MESVVSSPIDEFVRWMLIVVRRELLSMNFKKTRESGREWTESFEVVIVRHLRREKGMHRSEQWKKQVVMGDAD